MVRLLLYFGTCSLVNIGTCELTWFIIIKLLELLFLFWRRLVGLFVSTVILIVLRQI